MAAVHIDTSYVRSVRGYLWISLVSVQNMK